MTITATLIATSVIDNYVSAIGKPLDEESASRAHALLRSSKLVQLSPITRGRLTSSPSAHLKHGIANNAVTGIDKAAPDVRDAAQRRVVSAGSFGVYDHAEGTALLTAFTELAVDRTKAGFQRSWFDPAVVGLGRQPTGQLPSRTTESEPGIVTVRSRHAVDR